MYDLWMSLSALSLPVGIYFFVGLLIPRLPLVRTRGRAAKFLGLSVVALVAFGAAGRRR